MTAYFIRRFLLIFPTFLGITVLVFAITRFVPGGPVEKMMQQAAMSARESGGSGGRTSGGGMALSEDQVNELKAYYGFDKPTHIAYLIWLNKVIHLDLGYSTRYNEPVWGVIKDRFPISIFYGLWTIFLTYIISIPLGIWKGIRHGSHFDSMSSAVVFTGYAIPGYVCAIGLLYVFASHYEIFPLGGFVSDDFDDFTLWEQFKDLMWHGTLPLASYMINSFAITTLLMKNTLMDNLASDYVRTAISKGLPFKKAVWKHATQNSLIPLATHIGSNITVFISGSFLIETIFDIDGFGLLGLESLLERDYPVVMGILVISSFLFLIGNILSDIAVALVDPRVQFK